MEAIVASRQSAVIESRSEDTLSVPPLSQHKSEKIDRKEGTKLTDFLHEDATKFSHSDDVICVKHARDAKG